MPEPLPLRPLVGASDGGWPALPTETEIYILPNGEIVVADLPVELAASLAPLLALRLPDPPAHSTVAPASSTEHVTYQQHQP
jgi:hypothetical protein